MWTVDVICRGSTATGPMYFAFCRLYPSPPQDTHASAWLLHAISLHLTDTVSRVLPCLPPIRLERFRGSQKEDERGPLGI